MTDKLTDKSWRERQQRVRAIAEQPRAVRVPVAVVDAILRIERVQRQLKQELGRDPLSEEIGERIGIPGEQVSLLLALGA